MRDHLNLQQPEEEKKEDAIAEYYEGVKEIEKQSHETGIKKARTALYVTAALVFASELISVSMAGMEITPLLIGIALVEGGVFAALAYWTKKKPYSAIIIGLILFLLLWVFSAVVTNGEAAYKGIIIKVIIIVNLVQALKPAKAWEDLQKQ
ncbi:MAG: hypothetical protein NTW29_12795 [Bacteroidetes bacterium]|nr:hypothetical protein [Bacteroidota bacterium]